MKAQALGHTVGKSGIGVDSWTSFLLHPPSAGSRFLPLQIGLPGQLASACPHPPCTGSRAPCRSQLMNFTREGALGEVLSWKGVEKQVDMGRWRLCAS